MEVICVILAVGWFAVGWVAASMRYRRSGSRHGGGNGETSSELSLRPHVFAVGQTRVTGHDPTAPNAEGGLLDVETRRELSKTTGGSISTGEMDEGRQTERAVPMSSVEDVGRKFLTFCNEREVAFEQARSWFGSYGVACEPLVGGIDSWYVLLVSTQNAAYGLGLPAVRRAMGAVPLGEYYILKHYNGLDPLEPENVVSFCRIDPTNRQVLQKGIIHGR